VDEPLIVGEDKLERRPEQAARDRRRDLTRLAAAALAFAASITGLAARLVTAHHATPPAPRVVYPSKGPHVIFGDVNTPRPRGYAGQFVCTQELRRWPTHGKWMCEFWQPALSGEQLAAATDPGGACEERSANQETGQWECERQRVVTYGGSIRPLAESSYTDPGACTEEKRASAASGPWKCVDWASLPYWMPVQRPAGDGRPCMWRLANQDSGRWDCIESAPRVKIPPPAPGPSYRGIG